MSDDERPIYDERYAFANAAIATCRLEASPGDEIVVHADDCESDENDEGCTCEPLVLVVGDVASA